MNVTRLSLVLVLLVFLLAIMVPLPARADDSSLVNDRLAQEPYLVCVALETGMPAGAIALAKIRFDIKFGFTHNLTTADQWGATYGDRAQAFVNWLGVPNPTRHGVPLRWCARLIDAQARMLGGE